MFTLCTVCTCKSRQKSISLFIFKCTEFIVVCNEKVFVFILRFFVLLWEYAWVGKIFLSYVRICSLKWTNTYETLIHFHTIKIKTSCNSVSLSIFCNVTLFLHSVLEHIFIFQISNQRRTFSNLRLIFYSSFIKVMKLKILHRLTILYIFVLFVFRYNMNKNN